MPMYLVKSGKDRRIVKAKTKNAAINHVIRSTVTADSLNADELADLYDQGLKVEMAVDEKPDDQETPAPAISEAPKSGEAA